MKGIKLDDDSENYAALPDYGMPGEHLQAFVRSANAKNTVLAVRNVNPLSRTLIDEGCGSKPFGISVKTSELGLANGFLCRDFLLSGRGDPRDVKALELHQKRCLSSESYIRRYGFKEAALTLSEARIKELCNAGNVLPLQDGFDEETLHFQADNHGTLVHFLATKNVQGRFEVSYLDAEGEEQAVKVLADREGRFITSDYDLLSVCPSYQDFSPGQQDKSPFRTQSTVQSQKKLFESQLHLSPAPSEDEFGGNWSPRIQEMVHQLNHEISAQDEQRGTSRVQRVFHNAESNNPFADELTADVPCVVFFPEAIKRTELSHWLPNSMKETFTSSEQFNLLYLENVAELTAIRDFTLEQGFYWPAHVKFKDFKPLGRERYEQSVESINHNLKDRLAQIKAQRLEEGTRVILPPIKKGRGGNKVPIERAKSEPTRSTFFKSVNKNEENEASTTRQSLPSLKPR